ncbi:ABC transporter permease subunit [Intrasporangium sp.]|uniref:ABC transporter permease n=1 Tax=Intrasporangium sp. TaxID=1925024 RepID=UPI003221427D
MSADVSRLDLRLRRRMLLGTALGTAAYLLVVVAIYPSFKHDATLNALVMANPSAAAAFGVTGSITTPAGWLNANMYANFGPLLALLLTIGYGSAAIAGQDADGMLGLLATQPLSRARILAEKLGALLVCSAVVPAVSYVVCLAGPRFGLVPGWGALVGVTIAMAVLAFDLGALALLVGALTGSRGTALGVASGLAAATYLVSSLAAVNDTVHRIRWLSPFYWSVGNGQLEGGVSVADLASLAGLGTVLSVACVVAFRRLDIH